MSEEKKGTVTGTTKETGSIMAHDHKTVKSELRTPPAPLQPKTESAREGEKK